LLRHWPTLLLNSITNLAISSLSSLSP
jgi:hypothetical protein